MKLTKSLLKKIIKEEFENFTEGFEEGGGLHDVFNLPEPEMVQPSGNPKEDALRTIVAEHTAGEVDGVTVDAFSASAIVQVLDAINPQNKEKFLDMPIETMAHIAFKMMK
jgi:hypothetical protein